MLLSAAVIFAMFVANAEAGGVPRAKLGGTLQNDILKEYQAQKEYIFPPRPSLRLVRDSIAFCTAEMPRWHPVSISGYHIREAGSTAAQELAFTVANGFAYVELALSAGLPVDAFAHQRAAAVHIQDAQLLVEVFVGDRFVADHKPNHPVGFGGQPQIDWDREGDICQRAGAGRQRGRRRPGGLWRWPGLLLLASQPH